MDALGLGIISAEDTKQKTCTHHQSRSGRAQMISLLHHTSSHQTTIQKRRALHLTSTVYADLANLDSVAAQLRRIRGVSGPQTIDSNLGNSVTNWARNVSYQAESAVNSDGQICSPCCCGRALCNCCSDSVSRALFDNFSFVQSVSDQVAPAEKETKLLHSDCTSNTRHALIDMLSFTI